MQDNNTLVLEVFREGDFLKMGLFEENDASSTLRHYSRCRVLFHEIDKVCAEVISVLNSSRKAGKAEDARLIDALTRSGQFLWGHLLTKPVKERLKNASGQNLILSIDEELINIPWELLYDGSNFFCLAFNLGRTVRTTQEARAATYRSFPGVLKMLILANPTEDLQSAYLEGLNIRNQFDRKRSSVHINFKSTYIDKLYVKKNIHDYDIVHFAGHCEYEPDDHDNSGWVLSDGRFSVHDIMKMGESVSLPSLVFSNACHSADTGVDSLEAGYQHKHYSLASAFLFSGVRHYIGSIRKIEDPVSFAFAKEFYHQLILGSSVGESMRIARMYLVKEYGLSGLHWLSYLLYGDPNFVLFKRAALNKPRPGPGLREWISRRRKILISSLTAIAISALGLLSYNLFHAVNPGAYYLFSKAQKSYFAGNNKDAAALALAAISKEPLLLKSYPLLADVYSRMGKRDEALKIYFDYALMAQRRLDKKAESAAYIGIGWFYHLGREYDKASGFYNKALSLSRKTKDKLNEAAALRKLGVLCIDKKDFTGAFEFLTKSSEIDRQRQNIYEHRYNLACDYFDIGLLFVEKDDFETAKEFYGRGRAIFEKMKMKNEISDLYFNLGEICAFDKEYDKALDFYMSGLRIDEKQDNRTNLAGDHNMIGELYVDMNNFHEAEKSFMQALSVAQEIKLVPELALAHYNLGQLFKKRGAKHKARESLRSAQELYKKIDEAKYQEIKKEFLEMDGG